MCWRYGHDRQSRRSPTPLSPPNWRPWQSSTCSLSASNKKVAHDRSRRGRVAGSPGRNRAAKGDSDGQSQFLTKESQSLMVIVPAGVNKKPRQGGTVAHGLAGLGDVGPWARRVAWWNGWARADGSPHGRTWAERAAGFGGSVSGDGARSADGQWRWRRGQGDADVTCPRFGLA